MDSTTVVAADSTVNNPRPSVGADTNPTIFADCTLHDTGTPTGNNSAAGVVADGAPPGAETRTSKAGSTVCDDDAVRHDDAG